jgi:hypothetical protein
MANDMLVFITEIAGVETRNIVESLLRKKEDFEIQYGEYGDSIARSGNILRVDYVEWGRVYTRKFDLHYF